MQTAFALDRAKSLGMAMGVNAVAASGRHGILESVLATHSGMTVEARHPTRNLPSDRSGDPTVSPPPSETAFAREPEALDLDRSLTRTFVSGALSRWGDRPAEPG